MNILAISSILPIPHLAEDNDFVFQIYTHFRNQFQQGTIVILKPQKINLNLRILLKRKRSTIIHGFRVEIIPFLSSWRLRNLHSVVTMTAFFLNRKRLSNLFKEYSFDIIHAQFIFADGMLARQLSKRYGTPYMVTSHNELFYFKHEISKKIAYNILQNASLVTPINHANYMEYQSMGIESLKLTPLGFNKEFIRPQKKVIPKKIKIISVTRLLALKNIDQVLRALATLVDRTGFHYTIVGDGPERKKLITLTASLGLDNHVTFKGVIPYSQVADEMYQHDIFVMPSYYETFGRVYFEAMAMGIPIICARGSGIYGLFKEHVEGISVIHHDIKDIAQAMELLITSHDTRLLMGAAGQKLVRNYTWENIALDLHQKYLSCANINNL